MLPSAPRPARPARDPAPRRPARRLVISYRDRPVVLPLAESPLLYVFTLEEAVESLFSAGSGERASPVPEIAALERQDVDTVGDLFVFGLYLRDDEEIAPGIRKGDFFRPVEEVRRRMGVCDPESPAAPALSLDSAAAVNAGSARARKTAGTSRTRSTGRKAPAHCRR
jgi:hypothetical protein